MSTELRQKQIEFYVFTVPSIFQVRNDYFKKIQSFGLSQADRFKPNELIRKCGKEMGFYVFDLSAHLVEIENNHPTPYLYYSNEHHWSVAGNHTVAEYIHETLRVTSTTLRRNLEAKN